VAELLAQFDAKEVPKFKKNVIKSGGGAQLILVGGVAGAIRRKGGAKIQEECNKIGGGSFVGGAVITTGGNLKAKHVIHAVGPRMGEGAEDAKLRNAVTNSLKLMDDHRLKTIAFPAISTGIFGYPIERCAKIMISTAKKYLNGETQIRQVVLCLYSESDYEVFNKELK